MKKIIVVCICVAMSILLLSGCSAEKRKKIAVSFGSGNAPRWKQEKIYMEEQAEKLGIDIDVRVDTVKDDYSQTDECLELINSGIDVLIIRPKNMTDIDKVISLAKEKNTKIINYAGLFEEQKVDLFVGYDCDYIGQTMGKYLSEMVIEGDYILLSGDPTDKIVSPYLYNGAMKHIDFIRDNITIILDTYVPKWDVVQAKEIVKEAIIKNGNKVDAILAPNDGIAGACVEALKELKITTPVVITGMDAQLEAAKRIVQGTQACTVYMNFETLATTAIEEAYNMATGNKVNANAELDNGSASPIPSKLITGQLVTKENIDRILIDSGYLTKEEVYK